MFPKYYKELEESFSSANGSLRRPSWLFVCLAVDMRGDPELQREVMLPFQTRRFRVFGTFGDLLLIASFKALTPSVLSSLWSAPRLWIKAFLMSSPSFPTGKGKFTSKVSYLGTVMGIVTSLGAVCLQNPERDWKFGWSRISWIAWIIQDQYTVNPFPWLNLRTLSNFQTLGKGAEMHLDGLPPCLCPTLCILSKKAWSHSGQSQGF